MARSKRQERQRRDIIIVLIITALCIIIFGIGSIISFETGAFRVVGLYPEESMVTEIPTLATKPTVTATRPPTFPTASPNENQSSQAGSGFGISFSQLKNAFAAEGFQFEEEVISGQTRQVDGKSANALAALKIIAQGETIKTIQMVIHYPRNDTEELKKNLNYMVKSIKLAIPHWKDAVIWFYASVAELAKRQEDRRENSVLLDGIQIHLKLSSMPDLLFLTCETKTP